ncbi:type IV pili methyl-accepting chemotaxis transducer N-terminal domain-containing protein, partial [Thermodesulfobacteriota bacterium]
MLNIFHMLKSRLMAKITFILLVFFILQLGVFYWTFSSTSKQKADGLIINVAGAQRMLTQKMAKEASSFYQLPTYEKVDELTATINMFEKRLLALKDGGSVSIGDKDRDIPIPPLHISATLNNGFVLWKPFKESLLSLLQERIKIKDSEEALAFVEENNIELRDRMNKAVVEMQKASADGFIINIAGAQRMLSQQMAKEALLYVDDPSEEKLDNLRKTIEIFESRLTALLEGGEVLVGESKKNLKPARDKVKEALENTHALWNDFNKSLEDVIAVRLNNKVSEDALAFIMTNNIELRNRMNKAVVEMQQESEKKISVLIASQLVILLIAVGVVLIAYFFLRKAIVLPIKSASEFASLIEQGDLTGALI